MFCPTTKKVRLFRAWATRHPLWCAWQVTYRCNFRCRFCHYWHDPLGLAPEPPVGQFADGARKLASFGSLLISLAGGEPMIRTDLPDIVRAIGEYHFPFVTTNGWLVTAESARDLMEAGVWGVSVSIDYADPDRHNAARGMDDAWQNAWRAVELLSAARVHKWQRVNVMCVLLNDNIDQIEPLIAMAAKRDAYFMVQPYGQIKTGSKAFIHKGPVGGRLVELRRRWPNFLSNPCYLQRFDQFLAGGVPGCKAGRAFFNIDSSGGVAICVERKTRPIANLYSDSAAVIHQRLRAASTNNACTACWYNCRGEVESLYSPKSLWKSLPTFLKDQGRTPKRQEPVASSRFTPSEVEG
jgi:MoaA/NifB/PqqE/SkfB family radical SAM enzyme